MSSILRKAMWPATVVAGMLLLLGAIGTATAPTAQAATGDLCATDDGATSYNGGSNVLGIQGPFPNFDQYGDAGDHNLLLVNQTYLFAVRVENVALGSASDDGDGGVTLGTINVAVDDESGDADIETYARFNSGVPSAFNPSFVDLPGSGVDVVHQIDNEVLGDWDDSALFANVLTGWAFADAACVVGSVDGLSFFTVTCDRAGTFEISAWEDGVTDNSVTNDYTCYNAPATVTLTATPVSVESVPAVGNVSHSLIVASVVDSGGNPTVPGWAVDWTVSGRCTIDALTESQYNTARDLYNAYKSSVWQTGYAIENEYDGHSGITTSDTSRVFNTDANLAVPGFQPRSIAAAILHCEGATPGVASVRAEVDRSPQSDIFGTVDVTVVGPPAFITMTAAPSKLVCGEKATILVTVTDAINQKVSDHTVVELITNYGGVIGGTGATLGFPGINPVTPLSSGAAETFGGVATAYLLTSSAHVGAYEVVAAAGGSHLGGYLFDGFNDNENIYARNGVFSTPVVTSQVTVTCTVAAPAVTAPSTGTGTISPPNTGDAGLAAANSSTASLFVIAGAVAFVLAGLASFGYARRS